MNPTPPSALALPSVMDSTPELSPSSSATSSDEDYLSFSALSIGTPPLASPVVHVALEPSELLTRSDCIRQKDGICSYISTPAYLSPTNSHSPELETLCAPRAGTGPTETCTIPIPIPASSQLAPPIPFATSVVHKNIRRHRKSDSLRHNFNRGFQRPNHPPNIKFPETLPLNRSQLHGLRSPHPRYISNTTGTEALISLAWTGEISSPTVVSPYVPSRIGDTYMWPKLKISDATVRRASWAGIDSGEGGSSEDNKQESESWFHPGRPPSHRPRCRRWTLANAISDDQVTDESLVDFLEELRLHRLRSNERSVYRFLFQDPSSPSDEAPTYGSGLPGGRDIPLQPNDEISDDVSKAWSTARRTLLVCRELIRTERHYLSALNVLAKSETQSPPPPLMLSRLPALIRASSLFLDMMEKNPSVLGVCDAFIQAYKQLEEAFVQWCGVVGGFFTAEGLGDSPAVKRSNSVPMGSSSTGRDGPMTLKKRVGSWGRMMHSRRVNTDGTASIVLRNPKPRSRPSVRDLAILPTQRITRYVLLFKDLLIHSPSVSIRTTTENATELAMALARQADGAQDHASFRMS